MRTRSPWFHMVRALLTSLTACAVLRLMNVSRETTVGDASIPILAALVAAILVGLIFTLMWEGA